MENKTEVRKTPLVESEEITRLKSLLKIAEIGYETLNIEGSKIEKTIHDAEIIIRRLALRQLRHTLKEYEWMLPTVHEPKEGDKELLPTHNLNNLEVNAS